MCVESSVWLPIWSMSLTFHLTTLSAGLHPWVVATLMGPQLSAIYIIGFETRLASVFNQQQFHSERVARS